MVVIVIVDDDDDGGGGGGDDKPDEWIACVGCAGVATGQVASSYERHCQTLCFPLVHHAESHAAQTSSTIQLIQHVIVVVVLVVVGARAGRGLVQRRVDTAEVRCLTTSVWRQTDRQ